MEGVLVQNCIFNVIHVRWRIHINHYILSIWSDLWSPKSSPARTFADGVAVRVPVQEAFEIYGNGASRIVEVSESEIAAAILLYYRATHNLSEGAGAAGLAAALKEADCISGKNVGVVLTGGNIDAAVFRQVLAGQTPELP